MNKKLLLLYGIVLSLFMFSCAGEEDDIFDDSAANRLTKAIEHYNDLLCSSENGWIFEYMPTSEASSYIFLVKFQDGGRVDVACKNNVINMNKFFRDSSIFEVIGDNGPVLSFDTYNYIIHAFCDPVDIGTTEESEAGRGYEGDYEFMLLSGDENVINLKGKKRGTHTRLVKLAEGQDWENYFAQLDAFSSDFLSNSVKLWLNMPDGIRYTLGNGASLTFDAVPEGGDAITETVKVPFLLTGNGIRFNVPFREVQAHPVQEFTLSDDGNTLISVDNPAITITGPTDLSAFYQEMVSLAQKWSIPVNDQSQVSPIIWDAINLVKQSFAEKNIALRQISYTFSVKDNTDAVEIVTSIGVPGYLFFENKDSGNNEVTYTYKNQNDTNGKVFYERYAGVAELMDYMSGSFSISITGSALNTTKLRFTDKANPDIWFNLNIE